MRSIRYNTFPIFLFLCLLAASPLAAQTSRTATDLAAKFSAFDVVRLDTGSRLADGSRSMSIMAAGTRYDLSVRPHDMRAPRYHAQDHGVNGEVPVSMTGVNTYRGHVAGEATSEVRLNIDGVRMEGYFTSAGKRFFIEPATNYSAAARSDEYVVYLAENAFRDTTFGCGSEIVEKIEHGRELTGIGRTDTVEAAKHIEIATDADLEYVTTLGGITQANNEILGILNMTEGLYSSELNLSITVVFQHSWTTADPYAAASTQAAVVNFQAYWNTNFPLSADPRDTAHLFSGKTNLQSQGWAYIGVICRTASAAYGMSGYVNWAPAKFLITSHELGHNLGANHVDATQDCANSLMNAQLTATTPLSFCTYSRTEIGGYVQASGVCITGTATCPFDFDGDSKTDLAIFRPGPGEWWYLKSGTGQNYAAQFGTTTDKIAPADFTGDGKADIAFWRPSTGEWYVLRSEDSSFYAFPFGTTGDVPAPADYDADGKTDAAVFRPSTATWFISRSSGGTTIQTFGQLNDIPVPADYDGDGQSDIAIFRPGTGEWWLQRSTLGTIAFQFGTRSDKLTQGDFTGDGKADVAFWRPATGEWFVLRSENQSYYSFPFGTVTDVPTPGDYDGDGKFDAAVFRPSVSTWFVNKSGGGTLIQTFGQIGDQPVPGAFVKSGV